MDQAMSNAKGIDKMTKDVWQFHCYFNQYEIGTNMSFQPVILSPSLKRDRDSLYLRIGGMPIVYTRLNQLKEIVVTLKVY